MTQLTNVVQQPEQLPSGSRLNRWAEPQPEQLACGAWLPMFLKPLELVSVECARHALDVSAIAFNIEHAVLNSPKRPVMASHELYAGTKPPALT